jgi:hypothetical protein
MHPADNQPQPGPSDGQAAALDKLTAELRARSYQAHLTAPAGRPPSLTVTNPQATVLAETVMVDATSFWWSWAERIGPVSDVSGVAIAIHRVLASTHSPA